MGRRLNAAPPRFVAPLDIPCERGNETVRATAAPDLRAHDLLRLDTLPDLADAPSWVAEALARTPFVVVRRAQAAPGRVAIGVRGTTRSERYGMVIGRASIRAVHTPESLSRLAPSTARAELVPFAVLRSLQYALCLRGFAWGPTGSAGFELATGCATLSTTSDLDLLIRTPRPLSREAAQGIHDELAARALSAGIRIDAQLETPAGGVALAEWASGRPRVLVRGSAEPYLSDDPWRHGAD